MDLENQKRVKDFAEKFGPENIVVLLGAAEGEASGLAAETVTNGDPTYAGPLTGVQLGLTVYHVCEPEVKAEFNPAVYDEQDCRCNRNLPEGIQRGASVCTHPHHPGRAPSRTRGRR